MERAFAGGGTILHIGTPLSLVLFTVSVERNDAVHTGRTRVKGYA